MAGEITQALVSELGYRLRDPAGTKYTTATKLTFLNRAQLRIANMLRDEYLGELETINNDDGTSSLSQNGNYVTLKFSEMEHSITPLRGTASAFLARITITTDNGVSTSFYGKQIDITDAKRLENGYLGNMNNGIWFVFDSKVWVYGNKHLALAETGISGITVYYLKTPAKMSMTVDPEIAEQFHGIMLDFAEADCLALDGNWDGRSSAMERALKQIQELNKRYINPEGIGIKERE